MLIISLLLFYYISSLNILQLIHWLHLMVIFLDVPSFPRSAMGRIVWHFNSLHIFVCCIWSPMLNFAYSNHPNVFIACVVWTGSVFTETLFLFHQKQHVSMPYRLTVTKLPGAYIVYLTWNKKDAQTTFINQNKAIAIVPWNALLIKLRDCL